MSGSKAETRILDAAKSCSERWGFTKVTIDDIVAESGVSRATIYRLFPGGKDVMFEALRVRQLDEFFSDLKEAVVGTDNLEDLVVRAVVVSIRELRDDEHLAAMLASEPGETLGQLTVEGMPRIVRMASMALTPFVHRYLDVDAAQRMIDILARLTISYFLAPSDDVDFSNEDEARSFLRPVIRVFSELAPTFPSSNAFIHAFATDRAPVTERDGS